MAALIAVMSEIASFNGSYKRVKHEGLDAFLSLQGAPWPARKIICAESPTANITCLDGKFTIKVTGTVGYTDSFEFGADPIEGKGKKGPYMGKVRFEEGKIVVTKVTPGVNVMTMVRGLSEDKNTLIQVVTCKTEDGKEAVSTQIFERQ